MPPTVFGVEGRPLGPRCVEWRVGSLRACATCQLRDPESWVGVWQLATPHLPELYKTKPLEIEVVVEGLESWLRLHIAEIARALGLALVPLDLAREAEEVDREFEATRDRIRRGRKDQGS